jgi:putative transposase
MPLSDHKHYHRRPIRLPGYGYSQPGAYFATRCTDGRRILFDRIARGEMAENEFGRIVRAWWTAFPDHCPDAAIGGCILLPDYLHGIILLSDGDAMVGARHAVPLQRHGVPFHPHAVPFHRHAVPLHRHAVPLPSPERFGRPAGSVWQCNYYEHIIRNHSEMERISGAIRSHP